NHSGNYAEAGEFFEALSRRTDAEPDNERVDPTEYTLNRALQKSNLGEFGEADRLFAEVDLAPTTDMVQMRLRRNFRAIDALNRQDFAGALDLLSAPLPPLPPLVTTGGGGVQLDRAITAGLNSGNSAAALQRTTDRERLTPEERAIIIDAQAIHLAGTAQRLGGDAAAAKAAQLDGLNRAVTVRDGRVTSIIRLRAQMIAEIGLAEEDLGNMDAARARMQEAVTLIATEYPETSALASARARYAGFLARRGENADARALFRDVVEAVAGQRRTLAGFTNQLAPYFRLLVADEAGPTRVDDFFVASQLLVRPGVADTQAILARELSSGSDEGAKLFRQASNLARDIERARIEGARLAQLPQDSAIAQQRAELDTQIANLGGQQAATLVSLSAFPQFRAVEQTSVRLADVQSALTDGEAYVKMMIVGDEVYGLYATRTDAQTWRAAIDRAGLDRAVDLLRGTISVNEGGRRITYPYDAALARKLYGQLFDPVAPQMASIRHIIFEPDGAMLRLPLGALISDDSGLAAYQERLDDPAADAFDMREIAFVGRRSEVSTAVSALSFRNARAAPKSRAARQYFGLGQNQPAASDPFALRARASAADGPDGGQCLWGLGEWNRPIAATELLNASRTLGVDQSTVLTGAGFSDDAVRSRADLADYRILHFATHGFVTAPRPDCPARPALLTSFGPEASDGLLSFEEIFDLKIDADLVILSACDTAGAATIAATRAAGVTTGGGTSLDGLVRAFIGAGGRSVMASHWPVPDDYDATQRLIGGLFTAPAGTSIVDALGTTQRALMADPLTSHPYYWAGFAVVGDGMQALVRPAGSLADAAAAQDMTGSARARP
ncbi:MAG: hypothetical protein RLZZ58_1699, partial [Pseudomonadota bacterium]